MARFDELRDRFADTTNNASLWTPFTSGLATQGRSNGQIVFTPASSTATVGYGGYDNAGAGRDLTGSYAYVQIAQAVNAAAGVQQYMKLTLDGSNNVQWILENGTLKPQKTVATVTSDITAGVAFNATTHAWWQIRTNQGTMYFDFSSDGITWTNHTNLANPFAVTSLSVELAAGSYLSVASPGAAIFDNFNFATVTATVGNYQGGQVWMKKRRRYQRSQYFIASSFAPTIYTQSLTASLSFSAALVKSTSHKMTAALSFVAALTKFTPRALTAALSFSANLTKRTIKSSFTAALSFIGTFSKGLLFVRSFTGSLSFVGTFSKLPQKNMTAALSFSASLIKRTAHNMTAALSFVGNLVKRLSKIAFTAALSFSGALAKGSLFFRSMTASLSFSGSFSKRPNKNFTAGLSFAGTLRKAISKRFTAALSFIGNFASILNPTVGATYYVSATGNDSNNGTSTSTPWLTITKVNATALSAGDKVYFKGGDTFSGTITISYSGTAGLPIIFGSYGTGQATITPTTGSGVSLANHAYVTIQDLTITGNVTTKANGSAGILFFGNGGTTYNDLTIDNCTITSFSYGISVGTDTGSTKFHNLTVSDTTAYSNRDYGMLTYGQDAFVAGVPVYCLTSVTITGCNFYSNLGDVTNTTSSSGSGVVLGRCQTGVIENTTAYNNGSLNSYATDGPVGIWAYNSDGITIQSCLAYNNGTGTAADGDGFDLDINTVNSTIQYCLSYQNYGAGILCWGAGNGNTVRYNVTWGNGTNTLGSPFGEFSLGSGTTSGTLNVYNNTFISQNNSTTPATIQITATQTGANFRNNIIYAGTANNVQATNAYTSVQVLFQGNDYYRSLGESFSWGGTTYTSMTAWRAAATGQETLSSNNVGHTINPSLHNATASPTITSAANLTDATDYELQDTSLLIGQGLDMNVNFSINPGTRDYFNTTLGTSFDIGAAIVHYVTPPNFVYLATSIAGAVKSFFVRGAPDDITDTGQTNIATVSGDDTMRDIEGSSDETTLEGQTNTTELDN